MPDQQLPVSFSLGLDEKTDPKAIPIGKTAVLENAVFSKPGLLEKRNGLDELGRHVNPTQDTIIHGEALSSFEDQLLLFNGTKAYSYIEGNDEWIDKGNISSIINDEYQVIRNGYQQTNPDAAKVAGFECYVYDDNSGGVRYTIMDSETKNFIVNNQLLSLYASKPKVLSLNETDGYAAQFIITYVQDTVLKFKRIFIDALLEKTMSTSTTPWLSSTQVYDACVSQAVEVVDGAVTQEFNSIFVAYASVRDGYGYATPKVIKITPSGWSNFSTFEDGYESYLGPAQLTICPVTDMSSSGVAAAGPTAIIVWHSSDFGFNVAKIDGYGELVANHIALPLNFDVTNLSNITSIVSETQLVNQANLKVIFQFDGTSPLYTYLKIADLSCELAGIITGTTDFTNIKIRRNAGLYSKPFIWNEHVYFASIHDSTYQSTYFILNSSLEVVSKFNQNNGGNLRTSGLAEVISDGYTYSVQASNDFGSGKVIQLLPKGNGIFKIPTQKKGKIESEDNIIFSKLGVVSSIIDFKNENHFISAKLNDNLYTVGGILQDYDGNKFTEAGFNLYPEGLGTNGGPALNDSQFIVVTTQYGGPGVQQETDITCLAGNRINPGDIFQINSGLNERSYYMWFKVDGKGSDPELEGGLISLEVSIKSYYSSAQVATNMSQVLNLTGDFTTVPYVNVLFVQNAMAGTSVPPASISAGIGNITPGTYSYIVIWKYIDNKGRIHRSTTSIPETITTTAPDASVSVTVPILGLTTKNNVVMEVYRTEHLGALYRRVSSVLLPTFNIVSDNYRYKTVTFIDTLTDEDTRANELLYTTGDVLDNDSPPACSLITTFDNRLFIAGLQDKNLLQFSKMINPLDQNGIGGFSESLAIAFSSQGGDITALAKMDEKLIVFRETEMYYISGTGPSNANDGNNYNPPQLITSDVGCSNPNSVVLTPLGLMFKTPKGIYVLSPGMQVSYIGNSVEDHNDLTISSSTLVASSNQVRFTTEEGVALVFDYEYNQWSTFTGYTATDADLFKNQYVTLSSSGQVRKENDTYIDNGDEPIALVFETGWLSLANVQGYQRIKRVLLLGEFKGGHKLKVSFAYNFSPVFTESAIFDFNTKFTDETTEGVFANYAFGAVGPYGESDGYVFGGVYRPYQFRAFPTQQKCTSIKIRVEDDQSDIDPSMINEGYNLSNIDLVVVTKDKPNRIDSAMSKGTNGNS